MYSSIASDVGLEVDEDLYQSLSQNNKRPIEEERKENDVESSLRAEDNLL